jgi:hypothetical protein
MLTSPVPDLPPHVEAGHFDQLGNIEVLVLQCRSRDFQETNLSRPSSASGADSAPLDDRSDFDNETEDGLPANDVTEEENKAETVDGGHGGTGTDGASDRPTVFGQQGGPSDAREGYCCCLWHPRLGQGSSRFENINPSWCSGYGSVPPRGPGLKPNSSSGTYGVPAGPSHAAPPPRDERHVHFDYGQGQRPPLLTAQAQPLGNQNNPGVMSNGPSMRTQYHWQPRGQSQPDPASYGWANPELYRQQPIHSDPLVSSFQNGYGEAYPTIRYNDYASHDVPPQIQPMPSNDYRPGYHGYRPPTPSLRPSMWPLQQHRPGPETPVFIPPFHYNHPFYAQGGLHAWNPQAEPELPAWVTQKLAENRHGNPISLDSAKEDNHDQSHTCGRDSGEGLVNSGNGSDGGADYRGDSGRNRGTEGIDNGEVWGNTVADNGNSWNNNADMRKIVSTGSWDNTNNSRGNGNDGNGDPSSNQDNQPNSQSRGSHCPTSANAMPATIPAPLRPMYGPHGPYYTFKSSTSTDFAAEVDEEPRYDVPQFLVEETGTSRQVQPGSGYLYHHRRCIPQYLDHIEEPYARFIFKYRTKGKVNSLSRKNVADSCLDQLQREIGEEVYIEPSGNADMQELQSMDKQQIIELLLRAQTALGSKIPSPTPKLATRDDGEAALKQPVVVPPPNTSFLQYTLPMLRNRTKSTGSKLCGAGARSTSAQPAPTRQEGNQERLAAAVKSANHGSGSKPANESGGYGYAAASHRENQGQDNGVSDGANWASGGGDWASSAGSPSIPWAQTNEAQAGGRYVAEAPAPSCGW